MSRLRRAFPLFLAAAAAASGASSASCSRRKVDAVDAGPPVAAGDVLASFDALAPNASTTYAPRTLTRLGLAKAVSHDVVVPMPAGLHLRVTWETRDDLVFAERYLTFVRLTLDHLDGGASCFIRRTEAAPNIRSAATDEPIKFTIGLDYLCTEGKSMTSLAVPVGTVTTEGFQRIGIATGSVQPPAKDAADAPAVTAIHFKPASDALEPEAALALDAFIKVLRADDALTLCPAFFISKAKGAPTIELQGKRREVVRKYFADHDIAPTRLAKHVATGQSPPAVDDIELWPNDCLQPKATKR